MPADRTPALHPRLRVLDGQLEHPLRGTDHLRRARERARL